MKKQIPLIIVGPVSRPRNYTENLLSNKLSNSCESLPLNSTENFVNTLGVQGENKENLFFENGMHVNQCGHKRIANFLYKVIIEKYIKLSSNAD